MHELETLCGDEISSTINRAIETSKECDEMCRFEFNGVAVVVAGDSPPDLIHRDWRRGLSGYLGDKPTIGPYPVKNLPPEVVASDERIEAKNERRRQERQAEYEREAKAAAEKLELALASAPPLSLTKPDEWAEFSEKNSDPYGAAVVVFAERWGRLMQVEIEAGKTVASCADDCCTTADTEGITGFMYGCAVNALSNLWEHGEELRQWHNAKHGVAEEAEGVVNPAVVTIGS